MSKSIEIKLTLDEVCKLLSEKTGQTITPESHWVSSSIEMTRDAPPYTIIKLQATQR